MLKLTRSMFASLGDLKNPQENLISWQYIKRLYDIQEQQTLSIANKLKRSHLEWHKQKMKVRIFL